MATKFFRLLTETADHAPDMHTNRALPLATLTGQGRDLHARIISTIGNASTTPEDTVALEFFRVHTETADHAPDMHTVRGLPLATLTDHCRNIHARII